MSAIINNSFRKYQADNFISSFDAPNNIYLAIGKKEPWAGASPGEYNETNPSDVAVPIPSDTTISPFLHHDDFIALKKIPKSTVSHVIARYDWTSGTIYRAYDHLRDDILDNVNPATSVDEGAFYVFTETFRVYKCLSNNGNTASTVEPTGTSVNSFDTSDGYRWKFMFEVQQADVLKFVTSDWIPVNSPANSSTQLEQKQVEDNAIDGSLEQIDVSAGGTGYIKDDGNAQTGSSTNTIVLAATASADNDTYNLMKVYISSGNGAGELKTISDYVGATRTATLTTNWTTIPQTDSVYQVRPAVEITSSTGSGAEARVSSITGGVIEKVSVLVKGTGYRNATATVTSGGGTNATLIPRIGPVGGHGKNAVSELGGVFVMMNTRLIGVDGGDFPVNDDFRKVHLLINPKEASSGKPAATSSTYTASEIEDDSGEIVYTEFRTPINRSSDSTEDIKLVVEF